MTIKLLLFNFMRLAVHQYQFEVKCNLQQKYGKKTLITSANNKYLECLIILKGH